VPGLLRSLAGRTLSAGDRLTLTVSAPERVTERIAIKIRKSRKPTARLL
jgi:hypothetical protein